MAVRDPLHSSVIDRLVVAGCVAADAEAAEFLAAAPDEATLDTWLRRREDGEPVAWITGTFRFCGRMLSVEPGVYVPRPQTEELARRAAALLPDGGRALDLCAGSGAIGAHLMAQVPTARIIATDVDARAAGCARRNGVATVVADLAEPISGVGVFDVVTAVPPYVPTGELRLLPADVQRHEPRRALDGGPDGLEVARRVIVAAARLLRRGGCLLIEIGADQDRLLAPTLSAAGFGNAAPWWDDDGDLRGIVARATRRRP